MGIPARLHNTLSYSVALLVYVTVVHFYYPPFAQLANNQTWSYFMWIFHFSKRTLESMLLHRYSKQSPWMDSLIEYVYYWGFAYWISTSTLSASLTRDRFFLLFAFSLWAVGEMTNLISHLLLASLRTQNRPATKHGLPRGFLFEFVSCPHYFGEIISWVAFAMVNGTTAAISFCTLGTIILFFYATERHNNYKKQFENYPKSRKALIPGVY